MGNNKARPLVMMNRFGTWCDWQYWLTTERSGSTPMIAPPTSWMISPGAAMASPGAVHDDIPRVLGRPAISFRQFAEDFAEQLAKQVA